MNENRRQAQIARVKRQAELSKQGLCIKCGTNAVGKNNDGTTSVHCDGCKVARKPRVNERDVQNPRPRAYDPDDAPTHFESIEYAEYVTKVEAVVRYIDGHAKARFQHTCLGDIHNVLGRKRSEWTPSALNAIKARPLDMIPERYTLKPEQIKRLPLTEAKPFPVAPHRYKANEKPDGLGIPVRATI